MRRRDLVCLYCKRATQSKGPPTLRNPSPEENTDRRKNNLAPDTSESPAIVRGDNPIRRSEDDTLGRATAARSLAKQVLDLDASEGVVVGVLGPRLNRQAVFLASQRIAPERRSEMGIASTNSRSEAWNDSRWLILSEFVLVVAIHFGRQHHILKVPFTCGAVRWLPRKGSLAAGLIGPFVSSGPSSPHCLQSARWAVVSVCFTIEDKLNVQTPKSDKWVLVRTCPVSRQIRT
jgi:hypothetical protein